MLCLKFTPFAQNNHSLLRLGQRLALSLFVDNMFECLNVERPPTICLNVERSPTIWHAYSEREQVQQLKKMHSSVKMAGYRAVK